jgi:esterase/lipase
MKKLLFITILFSFSFLFSQEKKSKTEEIEVNSLIKGTLFLPEKCTKKTKLVILIAGSGPTDRNGNNSAMENNSLKFLAEGLNAKGIAVFSYDKRIFALAKNKTLDEKTLRFDDMIQDASDVFTYFKNEYKKIYFAGHSEGSLVGMVATKDMKANGFVSIAGAGRPCDEILLEQIEKNAPIVLDDSKLILASLKEGKTVEMKNPMLNTLFRESVQPYLISWMKYNPQNEIKNLSVPILIINGTKDIQVPQSDAVLLNKANSKSELLIIENMNHVLKEIKVDEDNGKSYGDATKPVIPELIEKISQFIAKN